MYKSWVAGLAGICRDADAFVVGTELDKTVQFEKQWRKIIAAIRERTSMPLTYAANWPSYQQVKFWDALDVIGIQAYFPLVDHDRLPSEAELEQAWAGILGRLEKYSQKHNRKILLAELGYDRSTAAARRPWGRGRRSEQAEETQRRCLKAALQAVEKSETVVGAFLWKWFAGPTHHENFLMSTPAMREVIQTQWGQAGVD